MKNPNEELVAEIVGTVLARLKGEAPAKVQPSFVRSFGSSGPLFDSVDDAVAAASAAQKVWSGAPRELKGKVIEALRKAMRDHAEEFSRGALEETGMGRYEDKIIKHHNSANATPGLEDLVTRSWSGDKGLVVEEYAPYGVLAAVTPSTHPVEVLFNSLVMIIAPGNGVVFNVHPVSKRVCGRAVELFDRVIQDNGGPPRLLAMMREPTLEGAQQLFTHKAIRMIVATGGPALVRAAFAAGKKVVAAGPGNPPVLVDETASLREASRHIIKGASFDNNILCFAEKEVFVVGKVFDAFMQAMADEGAVRLTKQQVESLAAKAFKRDDKGHMIGQREFVGKNASVLAKAVGVSVSDSVRLLYGEAQFDCVFVQEEQMMPYLPVVRVRDADEGIELALKAEHGFGHTAMIHSNNLDTITKFTRAMHTNIVVVNGPSMAGDGGFGGEGTFSHTIAGATGEGVCTPRNFARVRRLAVYRSLQIT